MKMEVRTFVFLSQTLFMVYLKPYKKTEPIYRHILFHFPK